jgi:hypothetical protein
MDLISEDAIEVFLNGISLGRRINSPYCFTCDKIVPGCSELKICLSGTAANLLENPYDWGTRAIHWLF